MISFPSALNEAHGMYGLGKFSDYKKVFDIEKIKATTLKKSVPVVQELLKEQNVNISNFKLFYPQNTMDINNIRSYGSEDSPKTYYENPMMLPADIIALAKDYEWKYNAKIKTVMGGYKQDNDKVKIHYIESEVVPSMFNPLYGISVKGMTSNVPLLNDQADVLGGVSTSSGANADLSNCTIRELCTLSKKKNSILGMARYRYVDFMYCKDLGKVSNNHLITLRKFAHPVPDHIFEATSPQFIDNEDYSFNQAGDIGRLVTWFGTDDNKLEDIINFSFHGTWKKLDAQWEQKTSRSDEAGTGVLGALVNTFHGSHSASWARGEGGAHSLWGWLGKTLGVSEAAVGQNNELLTNYDNNKVYTPKNTIQSTHIYEGKLEFSHSFTLNFSYKLRAYDNINPKSAFLDLIGNILEVTYNRSRFFWGGDRKIIGPPNNDTAFNKVNKIIDNKWDELGSLFRSFQAGGFNLNNLLGTLTQGAGIVINGFNQMMEGISGVKTPEGGAGVSDWANYFKMIFDATSPSEGLKGLLKNGLGRNTLYAWQSLLDGSDVGLWHVTIGNPKNPIIAMGNLIIDDDVKITQSGPLGLDDFPTDLKVSITLKHARPRDILDISKMYTKGMSSLYYTLARNKLSDIWTNATIDKPSEEGYANELDTIHKLDDNFYSDGQDVSEGDYIPDPKLNNYDEYKIIQSNNYSDNHLIASMHEIA